MGVVSRRPRSAPHLIEKAARGAAEPDLLVNNAGFGGYREFCDVDSQVVADLVSVHVMAVSRLARAAIPAMIARGSGAIINVASLLAFSGTLPPRPLPCRAVYAGAKAFQVAFTQALAGELAGTGVQVQACCPGRDGPGRDPVPGPAARRGSRRRPGGTALG
jgi:short-subunit dehydrogenase